MTKHIDFANMRDSLEVVAMRLQNALKVMSEEKAMLKTIKRTEQMRLDELIKYVWDNDGSLFEEQKTITFCTENNKRVIFDDTGHFKTYAWFDPEDLYTVEVEEEITEDTEFEALYVMMNHKNVYRYDIKTIKELKEYLNFSEYLKMLHQIYAMVDGKLELIWESEE